MLAKAGLEVAIEAGAGAAAGYPDAQYKEKGAKILPDRAAVFAQSDIVVQVLSHGANDRNGANDLSLLRRGQVLVGFLRPLASAETVQQVAQSGATAFAVELMPRTTRAQSMDALSSMASIAGYKAVIQVADALPRIFPMMTTAAGTITPSRVLVIGAAVAGVQGVTIIGPINLAGTAPYHSSQVYARNLAAFLQNLVKDGQVRPAESDDIIRDTLLTKDGEVVNARVREMLGLPVVSGQ